MVRDQSLHAPTGRWRTFQRVLMAVAITCALALLGAFVRRSPLGAGFFVTYIPVVAVLAHAWGRIAGGVGALSSIVLAWAFLFSPGQSGLGTLWWFGLAVIAVALVLGSARDRVIRRQGGERGRLDPAAIVGAATISQVRHARGQIVGVSTVARDNTTRMRAERQQRFLAAIVESSEDAIYSKSLDMTIQTWNVAAARIYGYTADEVIGQPVTLLVPPERMGDEHEILERLARGERVERYETERQRKDGSRFDAQLTISPIYDEGRVVAASSSTQDITERKRREREQANARRYAEQTARRIARLQAFTAALSEAVTPTDVANVTLRHVVEELGAGAATLAMVNLPDNRLQTIGVVGHSADLTERWHREADNITALRDAMRTAEVVWFPSWIEFKARYSEAEPPQAPVMEGARAAVPLTLRGESVGVLYMNFTEPRRFGTDELQFMLTLGRQCAQALERARLYAHEHHVAATLQQALLPTALPKIPGIQIDAVYRPGTRDADVGGDWYDALILPDGRLMLTIGDVVGRGLRAAVTMGQVRQAVRAAALEGRDPAAVLALASRLLQAAVTDQEMTTAIFGVLDPVDLTFTYATAGHPPAVLVVDGRATMLASGGLPLGFLREQSASWTVKLPPGALLVLYTDGLTEARRDPEAGMAALQAAAERVWHDPGVSAAPALVDGLGLGDAPDDIAVMTVRLDPSLVDRLDLTLPAEPQSLVLVRQALARLARAWRLHDARASALAVAVGEAVNNAIEHAYGFAPGAVAVRAWRDGSLLRVEIKDEGHWRSPVSGRSRGRGLDVMRAFVDSLQIRSSPSGTRVSFTMALSDSVQQPSDRASLDVVAVDPMESEQQDDEETPDLGFRGFAVHHQNCVPVVTIPGDVDLANLREFTSALGRAAETSEGPIVVTWGRPGYFDSQGVRTLLHAAERLATTRRALFLVVPPDWPLRRLIAEVGLAAAAVRVFESTEDAVAAARIWPQPTRHGGHAQEPTLRSDASPERRT